MRLTVSTLRWTVIFSEIDNTLCCSFPGRLDEYACFAFEQELLSRTAEFKNRHEDAKIIFDLDGVVFASSAFLRICLIQLKTFGTLNFTITNVAGGIYEVFYVSGFTEIMNVVPLSKTA